MNTLMLCMLLGTVIEDTTPPVLTHGALESTRLDISDGPASTIFTWYLTDDLSGVRPGSSAWWVSPSERQIAFAYANTRDLVFGTLLEGRWESEVTIPQFSEHGVWVLEGVRLLDNVNNRVTLTGPALPPAIAGLSFVVIPEPSSWVLGLLAILLGTLARFFRIGT